MVGDEESIKKPGINKPLIGVAAAVVIVALGAWYYVANRNAKPVLTVTQTAPPPAAPAEDAIEHPVPESGDAGAPPLPDLGASDKAISDALSLAVGAPIVAQYLVPDNIIRHMVVTVDNLPRQKVAVDRRPIVPAGGAFMVDGDEEHATLDSQNFKRYEPLVAVLSQVNTQRLAAVYLRFYPLFQKSYQDLGYPNGYFNDRLVKVIDTLLATPQPAAPIALVRPNVMYLFADPALESLPAGQKLLIRMGPDNAAAVKAKLEELRGIITTNAPRH
jgi:DUF3014 family protein